MIRAHRSKYIILSLQYTLFQKAVYTLKMLLKMGETVARNMQSKLKRINKTNFVANCWLLISLCDVIRIISVWNYCTNVSINLEFIAPLCQF